MSSWIKKLWACFGLAVTILLGLVVVSNAASISGQLTYSGTATGPVFIGAWTDPSMMSLPVSSVTIPSGAFPVNYLLPNLVNGTYYVGAYIDKDSNNLWNTGEPWGQYGAPDPITISGANIENKSFAILDGGAGGDNSISGTITYTGTKTGQLKIEVWDNSMFMGDPVKIMNNIGAIFPFSYYVPSLNDGTYYIKAYLDSNYNNMPDFTSEACGSYGSPDSITVSDGTTASSKNLTLNDPGGGGGGQGTTGAVINMAANGDGYDFSASTWSAWGAKADIAYFTYGPTVDLEVNNGNIKDLGMMDTAAFNALTTFDITGATINHLTPQLNNVYVFNSKENKPVAIQVTNINPTPALISFGWKYNYVLAQGPPFTIKLAVGSDTTPTSGAKVALYDSKGDWSKDNDVMISSSTTAGTYTTEDSNKYNVVINVPGTPTYLKSDGTPYNYTIYISMTGKRVEERMINFNATFPSTLYTSWIAGSSYIILNSAPTVAISDFGIKVGDTTATTGTISPDNDGTADFCDIVFKYTVTGATDSWEKGAQARICIDTNGDGVFTAFDYSKFFWDENGGPYYDKANPASWTWDKFQTAKTAGTLSQYKLSQQEFDALRAGTDWSMDQWIDSWGLDANNSTTKSIRWEGRDNSWNCVSAATYKVKIAVDNPNWFEGDGISWENYKTDTDNPLTVKVEGAGISGNVKNDQSVGIAGIRVNAGAPPPGGWGSAFTDANGNYSISGLKPGRYHVNTESGTSGYPNADYSSEVEVTAGNITTGINFTLERGGTISGTITIPAPGFKKYKNPWYQGSDSNDPGYWCTMGWLNIEAWSPNSPQRGWNGINVEDDGNDNIAQTVSYTLPVPPGTYNVSARMEGFASETYKDNVVIKGDATTLNITMTKAGSIAGTVTVPTAPTEPLFVDISAASTDGKYFGWGGTCISSNTTSTTYEIRSLPNATYTVRYNIWGRYKPGELTGQVVSNTTKDLTGVNYTFEAGAKIKGKFIINGSTADYQDMGGGGGGGGNTFSIWLNCWCPQSGYGTGTQITCAKQASAQEVNYEIGGLEAGKTYQVECWMFGFEMAGWPLRVAIPAGATEVTQDITMGGYSGSIAGTVTGTGVDNSLCRVTAREPWWGFDRAPKYSDVDSGGAFSITGLGTGEYIITCNEYYVKPSTMLPLGVPTGSFGTLMERMPLANGQNLTGVTLSLSAGAKITGTIGITSTRYTVNDLQGKFVTAVPMRMQWMGWAAPYRGQVNVNSGVATYTIDGLSDDIYVVTPPLYIEQTVAQYGMPTPDLACERRIVTVTAGGTTKNVGFTLTDGYSITGTVQRPVSGEEEHFYLSLQKSGGGWEEVSGTNVDFANWGPEKQDLDKRSLTFEFKHINTGNYIIKIFTPNYKVVTKEVTIGSANVDVGTVNVTKGATIKGKVVDADTGQTLSGDNGITVICEARPWIEGSWRSSDEWCGEGQSAWESQNSVKTGVFRLKNLPAGTYLVRINTGGDDKSGMKTKSATATKNYVTTYLAGITVPDSTEEVDIGTIKLRGGVTISGTVKDINGVALPNIRMAAEPSESKGEKIKCSANTDANGNFVIEGIDPLIGYWDVKAAKRPDMYEGIRVRYGEKVRKNVVPNATDVTFILEEATANLTGDVNPPSGKELAMPFPGETMPVAFLLLENTKEVYTDPMKGGIQQMTSPDGRFNIQGIVPGTYNLKIFSKGCAMKIVPNLDIVAGANSITDIIQLVSGGSVYGTIKTSDGKNISSQLYELPVASTSDFSDMCFGTFTSNAATKEIERYDIEGLTPGTEYYVVLAAEEGSNIYVTTTTVKVSAAGESVEKNLTYVDNPPAFIVGAVKIPGSGGNPDYFQLGIWATETLKEDNPVDVVTITTGTPANLTNLYMSLNRQTIIGAYTPGTGELNFTVKVTGHDTAEQVGTGSYTFSVTVDAYNLKVINPLMGGSVEIGEGDSTGMDIPPGSLNTTSNVDASISKVAEIGATVTVAKGAKVKLPLEAYPPIFIKGYYAAKTGATVNASEKVSPYYEYKITGANVADGKSVRVTLTYDPALLTQLGITVDDIDVYYLDDTANPPVWTKVVTNRTVDTVNHTISADVTHVSLFAVYKSPPAVPPTTIPTEFKTYAWPNPCKMKVPSLTIKVGVPDSRDVKIKIYNIVGELVREINPGTKAAGWHDITWDGKNDGGEIVASGVYLAQVKAGGDEKIIKIAIVK